MMEVVVVQIELIESVLHMDQTIALQAYDYEPEKADAGSGRLLQLEDDALADTLPSRSELNEHMTKTMTMTGDVQGRPH